MEETQTTQQTPFRVEVQEEKNTPDIGFPTLQPKSKPKTGILVFVVIGVLILGGGLAFFLSQRGKDGEEVTKPTPLIEGNVEIVESTPVPTPTPVQAATPKPVNRENITIEIMNGTGVTGEAAYLKTQLTNLGYSKITAKNADNEDYTSTVASFAKTLDSSVSTEITKKLNDIYAKVETKTSSSQSSSVVIITGPRKDATSRVATPKPTPAT